MTSHRTLAYKGGWEWSVSCLQDEMVMDFGGYTANSAQKIKLPAPPYVLEECLSIMWGVYLPIWKLLVQRARHRLTQPPTFPFPQNRTS